MKILSSARVTSRLVALLAACVCTLQVQKSVGHVSATDHDFDLDQFGDIVATYMRERRIPGASVAVAKDGKFFVSKGYGRASVQRLMTPWALMRIGSVSKVVTSVGTMKLVEDGLLQLSARVFGANGILTEYSPVADRRILDITVLDLLQHSSGWDHRIIGDPVFMTSLHKSGSAENADDTAMASSSVETIKDSIARFMMNRTLQYSPGTRYSYSNFGYTALGLVIERVTGRKYEQYMREILRRAAITRMKLIGSRRSDADIFEVQYFSRDEKDINSFSSDSDHQAATVAPTARSEKLNMAAMDSSCGWISTASDLARLFESLAGKEQHSSASASGETNTPTGSGTAPILRPETVRAMLARPSYSSDPQVSGASSNKPSSSSSSATAPSKAWYGLGVVVEDSGQTFWHSGTLEDSTSVVAHDGLSGFTWVALLNCRLDPNNDLGDFMRYAIRQIFIAAAGTALNPPPPSSSINVPFTASISVKNFSSSPSKSDPFSDSVGWTADQQLQDSSNIGRGSANDVIRASGAGSSGLRFSAAISNEVVAYDDVISVNGKSTTMQIKSERAAVARLVDSMSSDGRTAVKLTVADYRIEKLVNSIGAHGYRPTWLDAYDYRGQIYFNVIWTRNDDSIRWRVYFDLTPSRYRKRFRARVVQGFRLSHVETYVSRRKMRYAAIFVRDTWPEWTTYEGVSTQRHRAEYYRHLRDGYRLVVQSVTEYQGQLYVAAVYDKLYLGDSRVRLGLSQTDFSDELERQLTAGRVLSYVQVYEQRGLVRYSAVWTPKTSRHWAASHALSKYTILNKLVEYSSINVPLACVAAYADDDGGLYFAALWR